MASPRLADFGDAARAGAGEQSPETAAALFQPPERTGSESPRWQTKQIVLIRHGRSTWNEFLGQHKKAEWDEQERKRFGLRKTLRHLGEKASWHLVGRASFQQQENDDLLQPADEKSIDPQRQRGFWEGVRGGVKHITNAIGHAGTLHHSDHPLSPAGVGQARQLSASIAALVAASGTSSSLDHREPTECLESQAASSDAASVLLECKHWFVSPFLRALETAAYALAPLRRLDPEMEIRLTPQAREIVKSRMCLDCEGKRGNLGYRVIARALGRVATAAENEEVDGPLDVAANADRQAEIADVSAALCAMDLAEVLQVWWTDVTTFKKEHLKEEDDRVRNLVNRLLTHSAPCVGLVAHSLLFQRMIQLYWPNDEATRQDVRKALRHKAPPDAKDPLHDKMMNCGTLVLTWRYRARSGGPAIDAEITAAKFLFESCMEDALAGQERTLEVPDGSNSLDDQDDFVHVGEAFVGDGDHDDDGELL